MQDTQTLEVVIETDGNPIDVAELTEFLYHFRALYAAALHVDSSDDDFPNYEGLRPLINEVELELKDLDWRDITSLAYADLGDKTLGIVDIKRDNPLTIVFSGVAIILAIAVVVSGGKYKLGPLSVELPPLGEGISKLRQAFGRPPRYRKKIDP
ncbi:hypothetical protein QLQ86_11230 [Halomonas sp. LR5S13]|uniref:hypothetical protein n=1 Tax=Halomonas rhizosphaerae TaxID=3043296 RepID=UPI0024A80256|nr:hypothetical protein [Halomonas rhizosphaerae]MDI5921358.1 hypothetical protein [Halomonas rhizosphaerae]